MNNIILSILFLFLFNTCTAQHPPRFIFIDKKDLGKRYLNKDIKLVFISKHIESGGQLGPDIIIADSINIKVFGNNKMFNMTADCTHEGVVFKSIKLNCPDYDLTSGLSITGQRIIKLTTDSLLVKFNYTITKNGTNVVYDLTEEMVWINMSQIKGIRKLKRFSDDF